MPSLSNSASLYVASRASGRPLRGRFAEPFECLLLVPFNASAVPQTNSQAELRVSVAVFSSFAIPLHRSLFVLPRALAVTIAHSHLVLCNDIAKSGRVAVAFECFLLVLLYSAAVLVAPTQRCLGFEVTCLRELVKQRKRLALLLVRAIDEQLSQLVLLLKIAACRRSVNLLLQWFS